MGDAIPIQLAKNRFSELIRRVEAGEEVVITRRNNPVAKLVPLPPVPKGKRRFGSLKGLGKFDESFWDPLPDDFLGPPRANG